MESIASCTPICTAPYIGCPQYVSVNELVRTVAAVAGKRINVRHVDGPVGVQSRNFSNARIYSLGWRPKVFLEEGIALTYSWIEAQVRGAAQASATVPAVVCPDFECC